LDDTQGDVDSGDDTDEVAGEGSYDEQRGERLSANRNSTVAICYVCYDESEDDNPLIAPCKCSGDTKYIHVNCLKRWNTNGDKNEICAVLDESDSRTCSICKAPYPSRTKIPSGEVCSNLYVFSTILVQQLTSLFHFTVYFAPTG